MRTILTYVGFVACALAQWRPTRVAAVAEMPPPQQAPAACPGAALRMHGRFPGILPASSDRDAFDAWLQGHGGEADEDWREELFASVCDLIPAAHAEPVASLPAPSAEGADPQLSLLPIAEMNGLLPPLQPGAAATAFRDWLLARAPVGSGPLRILSDDLARLYAEHVSDVGREATPEGRLRRELARLPGVTREMAVIGRRQHGSGRYKERRQRSTTWVIAPVAAASRPARCDNVTAEMTESVHHRARKAAPAPRSERPRRAA